jgi:hypothetical protein
MSHATSVLGARPMVYARLMSSRGLRAGLLAIRVVIVPGGTAAAQSAPEDEEEAQARETYLPLPDFRSQPDRTQLAVDAITFIRVKRPDHSEALVAREPSGWEHVILSRTGPGGPTAASTTTSSTCRALTSAVRA